MIIDISWFFFFYLTFISVQSTTFESLDYCHNVNFTYDYCNYRDEIYPAEWFSKVTGYWCYFYGPLSRFKNGVPYKASGTRAKYKDGYTYTIPYSRYIQGNKTISFYYDYDQVGAMYVQKSFASDKYFKKWIECSKAADECCKQKLQNENICPTKKYPCPALWDAWDCFPQAQSGEIVVHNCPSYLYTGDAPCIQNSEKECFSNGTWNIKTNYETCQFVALIRGRHIFHVSVLGIATIICIPAIIIFYMYSSLRITRVILHRNLLISITIKNIFVIMSKVLITIYSLEDTTVLETNGVPCRMLAVFERSSVNAMYACMLVDGYYLHKLIVRVFSREPDIRILYFIVLLFSVIPILAWATVKAIQDDIYCWVVDESWRQWLIDGSRYAMLGINIIFMFDILRVFIWKLRGTMASSSQHTKVTIRATLILLPLFGIQFIMMSQRPVNVLCTWDSVFYYISYTLDSSQGIMVSLLYCYLNKDVQSLIKRTYERFAFDKERRKTLNLRKNTGATYVQDGKMSEKRKEIANLDSDI